MDFMIKYKRSITYTTIVLIAVSIIGCESEEHHYNDVVVSTTISGDGNGGESLPEPVGPLLPTDGNSCDSVEPISSAQKTCVLQVQVRDPSISLYHTATWMQLWVNDNIGFNVIQNWYEVGYDEEKVQCKISESRIICSFPDIAKLLETTPAPYTWWVRTWNTAGVSDWSIGATMSN